jgi:hypothetical protein
MRLRLSLAVALAVVSAGAEQDVAQAGVIIDRAAAALANDPVYVDPDAADALSERDADRIRDRIQAADAGPLYLAILPAATANEAGGDPDAALREIAQSLRRPGTYAAVIGRSFRAGATSAAILPSGEAGRLAREALEAHRSEGLAATLLDFVDRLGRARASTLRGNDGRDRDQEGSGTGLLILLGVGAGGIGLFALRRRRRRAREEAAQTERLREFAREDVVALADALRELDPETERASADPRATEDLAKAGDAFSRADDALERARRPEDFEEVTTAVADGRHLIECVKARLAGREPPERRPHCFFDPRHGPSTREVDWSPDGGAPRPVPACEADAQRVERGLDPEAREVMVGGASTPYWNAPGYFGPWAGGYFGGFGFGGFLPGLLFGSLLSGGLGGWAAPAAAQSDYGAPAGDFGDFGGGFDGGDFGGGDFGGGDFGGGGGDF